MALLDGDDPLDLLRLIAGLLLAGSTLVAAGVWLLAGDPRMLALTAALWAIYGLARAVINGFLSPLADLPAWLSGARGTGPVSSDDLGALTADPEFRATADRYRTAAATPAEVDAAVAAAEAEPPAAAIGRLEGFRKAHRLTPAGDVRVGLALVRLHDDELHDPAAALREVRRLLTLHSDPELVGRIRTALARWAPDLSTAVPPAGSDDE